MRSFLVIPLIFSFFSLNFFMSGSHLEQRFSQIEQNVNTLMDLSAVNNSLHNVRNKIAIIIDKFNAEMSDSLKLAIADEIYKMSIKYPNLDVDLLCATITHESGRSWAPNALSPAGAMGLMQIMPSTGQWLSRFEGIDWTTAEQILYNPVYNIRLGARYLSTLVELYGLEGGLAAYNGGGSRVRMWLANGKDNNILWAETRNYIPFVLKLYNEFQSITL